MIKPRDWSLVAKVNGAALLAAFALVSCTQSEPSSEGETPSAETEGSQESESTEPDPADIEAIKDVVRRYRLAADDNDFAVRKRSSTGELATYADWFLKVGLDPNTLVVTQTKT